MPSALEEKALAISGFRCAGAFAQIFSQPIFKRAAPVSDTLAAGVTVLGAATLPFSNFN